MGKRKSNLSKKEKKMILGIGMVNFSAGIAVNYQSKILLSFQTWPVHKYACKKIHLAFI